MDPVTYGMIRVKAYKKPSAESVGGLLLGSLLDIDDSGFSEGGDDPHHTGIDHADRKTVDKDVFIAEDDAGDQHQYGKQYEGTAGEELALPRAAESFCLKRAQDTDDAREGEYAQKIKHDDEAVHGSDRPGEERQIDDDDRLIKTGFPADHMACHREIVMEKAKSVEKQQKTLNKQKELNQETRDNYLMLLDKQQKELGYSIREVADRQRAISDMETTLQNGQTRLQSYIQETQQKAVELAQLEAELKARTATLKAEQKSAKSMQ